MVDIDPQGSFGPSKGPINSQGVEWVTEWPGAQWKLLGSAGDTKPPIQNYC